MCRVEHEPSDIENVIREECKKMRHCNAQIEFLTRGSYRQFLYIVFLASRGKQFADDLRRRIVTGAISADTSQRFEVAAVAVFPKDRRELCEVQKSSFLDRK